METSIKLGRIWGIPIGLHWSLFVVFGLITWSLALGYFPEEYPSLSTPIYWLLGLITSILFFGSILLHELGHAIVALRNQVPVRGITLFIFGGVAQLEQEARSPGAEFRIAIAGPAVSLALAGLFESLWLLDQSIPYLAAPSIWLARINLMLAAFNLIPGFPLDGGRVLRAIVWRWTGSLARATKVAAFTGQLAAFGFIGWGIFAMFSSNFFNGLWLVFIGWFLQNAAASSQAQTNLEELLRGITVGRVMSRDYSKVPGTLSLSQLVEENVLAGGHRYFLVGESGHVRGMVTLRDVTAVPQRKWQFVTTEQVMVPLKRLTHVQPDTGLMEALQTMDNADVAQLPVMNGEDVVGMVSRDQVLHYVRTRAELGI
jgi:Zn-dependent protease/CBS domain-containing protein